ncbi:purine-binding chemotaxis protein CheW [Anaerotaenia torta]|uniref:chemotaxis protein CheW n=1 Tax=Anaerotaenia torta TaxID=433293 RepID=UPI003D23B44A
MSQIQFSELDGMDEDAMGGKYLTFSLGENDLYGMEIRYITEIISIPSVTQVPEMPEYIKGITNLRGQVIPVMDARLRFGKTEKPYDERTCIIVVDTGAFSIGLVVDSVDEVLSIQEEDVAALPDLGKGGHGYMKSIGKAGGKITLLLDAQKLLSDDELTQVNTVL